MTTASRRRLAHGGTVVEKSRNLGEFLLADDDQGIRDMLMRVFKNDFTLLVAKDGIEALSLVKGHKPVALLVDEMMPGMRGTDILAMAKEQHPHAVRMLMTAGQDFEAAVRAVNHGEIDRFFSKPLRPVQIREIVLELVNRRRAEEMLRVEISTLNDLRARKHSEQEIAVLIVGKHPGLTGKLREACERRRFRVEEIETGDAAEARLFERLFDLVILVREAEVDIERLARVARTADESIAVAIAEADASLAAAMQAHALGADYVVDVIQSPAQLTNRLERAALARVQHRDMRRLTSDLLLANRQLAQERRRTEDEQVQVLNAMIRALEARDAYTAGHTDRVAAISVRLSEVLGYDAARTERIRVGALLHDIGKIGVRDDVLLKPGALTPDEYERIKVHTTLGDELLRDISQFRCIVSMIRHHHEKVDGSGYPDGLMGENIPVEARVVAVADVLDAITSTRPYRKASDVNLAFNIMEGLKGHHLDAHMVDALISLHRDGRLIDLLQPPGEGGFLDHEHSHTHGVDPLKRG